MALDAQLLAVIQAIAADIKALIAGGGGGGIAGPHALEPGAATGGYVSAALNATALSTIAAAANRIDFYPYRPSRDIAIDELALEVTTLVAASQARVGIYSSTVAGLPDALLTGQGSLLDCASTGAKASAVGPITLTAGTLYYIAVHSSAAQTYRGLAVAALLPLGHTATGTAVYTLRRGTAWFATGLPAVAPATTLTSAIAPWVRMRID